MNSNSAFRREFSAKKNFPRQISYQRIVSSRTFFVRNTAQLACVMYWNLSEQLSSRARILKVFEENHGSFSKTVQFDRDQGGKKKHSDNNRGNRLDFAGSKKIKNKVKSLLRFGIEHIYFVFRNENQKSKQRIFRPTKESI